MDHDFFRQLDAQINAKKEKRTSDQDTLNRELTFSRKILSDIHSAASSYYTELNNRKYNVNVSNTDQGFSVTLSRGTENAKFAVSLDDKTAKLNTTSNLVQDEVNAALPYEAKDAYEEFHRRFKLFIREFVLATS